MGPLGAAGVGIFLVNWEMETPALTDIVKSRVSTATALGARPLHRRRRQHRGRAVRGVPCGAGQVGGVLDGKAWLSRHQRPIVLVLFCLIGAVYTYKGASALLKQ